MSGAQEQDATGVDLLPDAIRTQLERILASPAFKNGQKLSWFLSYVVGQTLNGRLDQIKQYTIAVEGLGYQDNFDPATSPTVRILARRVRRSLDQYYAEQGAGDPIRIYIPKGSYVPVFLPSSAALPVADRAIGESQVTLTKSRITEPTIAVISFKGQDEQNDASVAEGLTRELLVALTRFTGLSVIGPLAGQSEAPSIDFRDLYSNYGASFALRGSIRSNASRVRITAELIETYTGYNQWGHTFEYDLDKTSLFEIEDDFSSQVAGVVADSLGVVFRKLLSDSYEDHIKTSDVTKSILAFNKYWITLTKDDLKYAIRSIEKSIERCPDNALLCALQADLHYSDVLHWLDVDPDSLAKMVELSSRAILLDSNLQFAQYNLVVQNAFFGKERDCIDAARTTVAMNPNHAMILAGCAVAVTSVGNYEFGQKLIEDARRMNPSYPGWYFFIDYLINYRNEQYDDAWDHAQRIEIRGLLWHPILRAAVLGKLGRPDDAKHYVEDILTLKPDFGDRPQDYIRRLFVTDEHVDMIMDGLQKAGIQR